MEVYVNLYSRQDKDHVKKNSELISEAVQNAGLFENEQAHMLYSHVKEVNILLNSGKTRENGVKLLLPLARQCPQKVLGVQGERWFRFCTQIVNSVCTARAKVAACQVISSILRDMPNVPELQRSILSKPATPLIITLAAADSSWNCAALECLYEYMKLAPGQCLPHKTVLEEHILGYLDHPLTKVGLSDAVSRAGQVFAALPLPGMGGSGAQGRSEARGRQLTQLVAVSHSLMDYLFDGIIEKESYEHTREYSLNLTPLNSPGEVITDTLRKHLAAVTRLVNSLRFIGELITADANDAVTVVPHDLLSAVFRCLQVDQSTLTKYPSQEHKFLTFLMPSVQQHCLLLIRDMLLSIGESIDLYFGVIAEILLSTIKASVSSSQLDWCTSGQQTRIIAYSVMSTVIQVSGGRHTPSFQLARLILEDVVPKSHQVRLQKTQDKGLSSLSLHKKKSKKKGYAVTVADSSGQAGPVPRPEYFSRTARVALCLIETLFAHASHSMLGKTKQSLLVSVMAVAATVTGASQLPVTYEDGKTRAQLFKTLASMATHPQPGCEPPYTMILHHLHAGLNDSDMLVVSACQVGLGSVSFILANPEVSSMMYTQQQRLPLTNGNGEEEEEDLVDTPQEEEGNLNLPEGSEEDEEIKLFLEEEDEDDSLEEEDEAEGEEKEIEKDGEEVEEEERRGMKESAEEKDKQEFIEPSIPSSKEQQEEAMKDGSKKENEVIVELNTNQDDVKEKADQGDDISHAEVSSPRHASQESACLGKRTALGAPSSHKKSKKRKSKASADGPTLEEMLASFVNCDPDT